MFQIKDFASIAASQINLAKANQSKITDFSVGSAARTLMDAPAAEIEELYHQMFSGLLEAIPVAVYKSFNFSKLPARSSSGYVTFARGTAVDSVVVPQRTVVVSSLGGVTYETQDDLTLAPGVLSGRVLVVATTNGAAGNAVPGQINKIENGIQGITSVTNIATFSNGTAEETEDQRAIRFAQYIAALSRSTVASLHYAAKTATLVDGAGNVVEYVTRTGMFERPGYVQLYIYSNSGLPSAELLLEAQSIIDGYRSSTTNEIVPGWRAAGVEVVVLPMADRPIALDLSVSLFFGRTLDATMLSNIRFAVDSVMRAVESGSVLYASAVIDAVLKVSGVQKVLLATDQNVMCGPNEVLTVGTLNVGAL